MGKEETMSLKAARERAIQRQEELGYCLHTRRTQKPTTATGEERKKEALERHESSSQERLRLVRGYLKGMWIVSGEPQNADHAREFCRTHGIPTGPWMGAIFRGWERVRSIQSRHRGNNGRWISTWRPK